MLSMLMCIQNLVRFCQFVVKILSGNQIFTDSRNHGKTESRKDGITGQGESSRAPLFQSGAIKIEGKVMDNDLSSKKSSLPTCPNQSVLQIRIEGQWVFTHLFFGLIGYFGFHWVKI